jgi:hypothetical protein
VLSCSLSDSSYELKYECVINVFIMRLYVSVWVYVDFPDLMLMFDRLCGLVVRVPGYRYRGPDSIPGATRFFSEK